jgi:hypothetical protein
MKEEEGERERKKIEGRGKGGEEREEGDYEERRERGPLTGNFRNGTPKKMLQCGHRLS